MGRSAMCLQLVGAAPLAPLRWVAVIASRHSAHPSAPFRPFCPRLSAANRRLQAEPAGWLRQPADRLRRGAVACEARVTLVGAVHGRRRVIGGEADLGIGREGAEQVLAGAGCRYRAPTRDGIRHVGGVRDRARTAGEPAIHAACPAIATWQLVALTGGPSVRND